MAKRRNGLISEARIATAFLGLSLAAPSEAASGDRTYFVRLDTPTLKSLLCGKLLGEAPAGEKIANLSAGFESYRDLIIQAKAYEDAGEVGRTFPTVAIGAQPKGRALLTREIDAAHLPYSSQLKPSRFDAKDFPRRLEDVGQADLQEISDIVLWNDQLNNPPRNAYARLGVLKNGRPVAVVTHFIGKSNAVRLRTANTFEERVLSAKLLSDLGIGPRFHGLVGDGTEMSYVVDLVPGGAPDRTGSTLQTLKDRTEIFKRLRKVGIPYQSDYQEYSNGGRLLIIDPEGYFSASNFERPAVRNPNTLTDWTEKFVSIMLYAHSSEDIIAYMKDLKSAADPFFNEIVSVLRSSYGSNMKDAKPGSALFTLNEILQNKIVLDR